MKHFQCKQGSDEWLRLRMGKPTASAFDELITAAKWEPTKGEKRRKYAIYLLTELILDAPLSGVTVAAMEHGHTTEEKAVAAYEMLTGKYVKPCGFIMNDAMTYGASPDSLCGEDEEGSLEIKSPYKPEIHVGYMMKPETLVEEYFVQTQGQLYVRSNEGERLDIWTDLVSYMGTQPMVTVRCTPLPAFQEKLHVAVRSFCAEFSDLVLRAKELGFFKGELPAVTDWIQANDVDWVRENRKKKAASPSTVDPDDGLGISDADLERMWGEGKVTFEPIEDNLTEKAARGE